MERSAGPLLARTIGEDDSVIAKWAVQVGNGAAGTSEPAMGAAVQRAVAAPGPEAPSFTAPLVGENRSDPAPSDQPVTAGPWSFTILEYVAGGAASELVANAHWSNASIRDGMQFVAVRLTAANTSSQAEMIQNGDFGVTGDRAVLYRFVDVQPPDPILHGTVQPGESLEGWIVAAAEAGEGNLCLVYDSLTIGGNWADVVIALDADARIADTGERLRSPNQTGGSITSPAAVGEVIATDDWVVTAHQVIEGRAVYNLFPSTDYRTTALGDTFQQGLPYWIGLEVTISNNRAGGDLNHFPATAFIPVDGSDDPFLEALLLTPPNPTVVGGYYPGGTRRGWMLISMPVGYSLDLVRFRPSDLGSETRYITLTGAAGTAPAEPRTFSVGDIVTISEDQVNMRSGPSTNDDIVAILERGDRLVITGESREGSGFTWYPVEVEDSGDQGFVASHLIELVG